MALLAHTEQHFPAAKKRGQGDNGGWTDRDLVKHFFTILGVDVWIEGELYSFKYNMLVVNSWNAAVDDCRGSTLERLFDEKRGENTWRHASRPFAKFFNKDEPQCPLRDNKLFLERLPQFTFAEKADGTCIQMWHLDPARTKAHTDSWIARAIEAEPSDEAETESDAKEKPQATEGTANSEILQLREVELKKKLKREQRKAEERRQAGGEDGEDEGTGGSYEDVTHRYRHCIQRAGGWRASTLGRITTSPTLEGLFFKFFLNVDEAALASILDNETTYLFELCCKENRVVTSYESDRLYLIGARRHLTGDCLTLKECDLLVEKLRAIKLDVIRPRYFASKDLKFENADAVYTWVEEQARFTDIYGVHPEGFVVVEDGTPVAKIKNKAYFGVHQLRTSNLLQIRSLAIQRYFDQTIDDVYADLPTPIQAFVEELKAKLRKMLTEIEEITGTLRRSVPIQGQIANPDDFKQRYLRAYLLKVKELVPERYQGFFLQFKFEIAAETEEIKMLFFNQWLKKKYNSFEEHWKDTKVPEILEVMRQQNLLPKK